MGVTQAGNEGTEARSGYEAIFSGLAALPLSWDVVAVRGPDAERYLQSQLSQDISGLGSGEAVWSLVLQPQGRLVCLLRVFRRGADEFLLVTDAGVGATLAERLKRFLLRTKADIEQLGWQSVALRGALAQQGCAGQGGPEVAVPFGWGKLTGCDLLGGQAPPPAVAVGASLDDYEAARIEAGFPRHGAELDERTIPAEAGLVEASVSFTKGCYPGQELVARIDSRGSHVPRRLRGLLLEGPVKPVAELFETPSGDGKVVGRLTSAARSPRLGWVALAYTSRNVEPGQAIWARTEAGPVAGEVRALPLVT